ncbi:helix-turn-helix domain-containing protein [Intestinibacter sp.]|uniref:helix-turn-helix domain-containing protein n=1 Tax=Intestinibacter sp. TaxID=1965304 RepID=UPI003F07770B
MEKKNEQYVIYPHNGNSEPINGLTPQDKLIYLAIRRYMNRETMESFPSYATITKDIGAAAKTIKKSVDNLVNEGYLNTRRDGKKIIYKFNNKKQFEPFSWEFLDKPDLTFTEKSYIVAAQQYMFKDNEEGKISYKNSELSKLINMTESTISRCNHSLERKGYLEGAAELIKKFQLRELDQLFIWKFKEQDERIDKNTEDIAEIKRKLAILIAENEKLKEKIKCSDTYII